MVTYMEPQTAPSYMSVKCVQQTLRIPNFTCTPHAQQSLSDILKWDSNFSEPSNSWWTNRLGRNFPTSPQNQNTKLTHCLIYMSIRTISERELLMPSPEVIDLTLSDDETQPDPVRSNQGTSTPTRATNRFRTSSSTAPMSSINRTRWILPVIQGTFAAIK